MLVHQYRNLFMDEPLAECFVNCQAERVPNTCQFY